MHATFTLMPAAYTSTVSVQVPGFEDIGLLTHCDRLICDFCSSSQCFAFSFLQIPSRDGHPCRSANRSPCRADSGLSPPSHPATTTVTETAPVKALRAMPGAPKKKTTLTSRLFSQLPYRFRNCLCTAMADRLHTYPALHRSLVGTPPHRGIQPACVGQRRV
jgi:hypothetical protein